MKRMCWRRDKIIITASVINSGISFLDFPQTDPVMYAGTGQSAITCMSSGTGDIGGHHCLWHGWGGSREAGRQVGRHVRRRATGDVTSVGDGVRAKAWGYARYTAAECIASDVAAISRWSKEWFSLPGLYGYDTESHPPTPIRNHRQTGI